MLLSCELRRFLARLAKAVTLSLAIAVAASGRTVHAAGGAPPACLPVAQIMQPENSVLLGKDICVSAHVYHVAEVQDGTRFLDVCPPDTTDDACRFTIPSLWEDHDDVGDLRKYQGRDVSVRGTLRVMHGRMGIVLTHARQLNGGPEKFRPNPKLLRGFNGQAPRTPAYDPNLISNGAHRSFMNEEEKETLPRPVKH